MQDAAFGVRDLAGLRLKPDAALGQQAYIEALPRSLVFMFVLFMLNT